MRIVTKELALRYFWPHLDYGKSQICAKFALGKSAKNFQHGDVLDTSQGKATFRLLDAGMYDDWFVSEALPILKQHWVAQ